VRTSTADARLAAVPVKPQVRADDQVRVRGPTRAHRDLVEIAGKARTLRPATSIRRTERRKRSRDAETVFVAEPFAVDTPAPTIAVLVVQVLVDAVPTSGVARGCRFALYAKVALNHISEFIAQRAAIDQRLEVTRAETTTLRKRRQNLVWLAAVNLN